MNPLLNLFAPQQEQSNGILEEAIELFNLINNKLNNKEKELIYHNHLFKTNKNILKKNGFWIKENFETLGYACYPPIIKRSTIISWIDTKNFNESLIESPNITKTINEPLSDPDSDYNISIFGVDDD